MLDTLLLGYVGAANADPIHLSPRTSILRFLTSPLHASRALSLCMARVICPNLGYFTMVSYQEALGVFLSQYGCLPPRSLLIQSEVSTMKCDGYFRFPYNTRHFRDSRQCHVKGHRSFPRRTPQAILELSLTFAPSINDLCHSTPQDFIGTHVHTAYWE
ncbi:hypothetical protein F4809DRAFT_316582 [Biscogniauxia mediterranea]|nr:hypothetical protein F4809DRAFT_316582 [Biscogniauxia mediterranea]